MFVKMHCQGHVMCWLCPCPSRLHVGLRVAILALISLSLVLLGVSCVVRCGLRSWSAVVFFLLRYLRTRLELVLRTDVDFPCTVSYSSDATSFVTKKGFVHTVLGASVKRDGRELTEMLIERCHVTVKTPPGQQDSSAILVGLPRHLLLGKKMGMSLRLHVT
jgi:hypothetical protein